MEIKNVSKIDFEKNFNDEDFSKKLRHPSFEPTDFSQKIITDEIQDLLEKDNVKILEIGCGWGRNAEYFRNKLNVKYYGFDPSEASKDWFEKQNLPKERFYFSKEVDEEIMSHKYDFIFSTFVLQHVGWPPGKLNEKFNVDAIIKCLIPTLKDEGMMMFYELHKGQNDWSPSKLIKFLLEHNFYAYNMGSVHLDLKQDPHDLMFAKRKKQ